ncbi:hypothetical protein GCM10022408_35510 [Hymenobacter fastidiosus]|uniref:Methyltransferase domain-containing protein n=1 Tax=Hymenobacter fastidiosus TaxID=486264 RepID=A0ABP7SZC3_9BACT
MNIQQAYNAWAASYDTVINKTRDLEARAIRDVVPAGAFPTVIELGCGTGKNTTWLAEKAGHLTAVDFSAEMLHQAQQKRLPPHVHFRQADITQPWTFADRPADLITCSLILEHISDLDFVFSQARQALQVGGRFYLGELHPFRQYQGSKARFVTPEGVFELPCYVHHLSDYLESARQQGLHCVSLREWFDEDDRTALPHIMSLLLERSA